VFGGKSMSVSLTKGQVWTCYTRI